MHFLTQMHLGTTYKNVLKRQNTFSCFVFCFAEGAYILLMPKYILASKMYCTSETQKKETKNITNKNVLSLFYKISTFYFIK